MLHKLLREQKQKKHLPENIKQAMAVKISNKKINNLQKKNVCDWPGTREQIKLKMEAIK